MDAPPTIKSRVGARSVATVATFGAVGLCQAGVLYLPEVILTELDASRSLLAAARLLALPIWLSILAAPFMDVRGTYLGWALGAMATAAGGLALVAGFGLGDVAAGAFVGFGIFSLATGALTVAVEGLYLDTWAHGGRAASLGLRALTFHGARLSSPWWLVEVLALLSLQGGLLVIGLCLIALLLVLRGCARGITDLSEGVEAQPWRLTRSWPWLIVIGIGAWLGLSSIGHAAVMFGIDTLRSEYPSLVPMMVRVSIIDAVAIAMLLTVGATALGRALGAEPPASMAGLLGQGAGRWLWGVLILGGLEGAAATLQALHGYTAAGPTAPSRVLLVAALVLGVASSGALAAVRGLRLPVLVAVAASGALVLLHGAALADVDLARALADEAGWGLRLVAYGVKGLALAAALLCGFRWARAPYLASHVLLFTHLHIAGEALGGLVPLLGL